MSVVGISPSNYQIGILKKEIHLQLQAEAETFSGGTIVTNKKKALHSYFVNWSEIRDLCSCG